MSLMPATVSRGVLRRLVLMSERSERFLLRTIMTITQRALVR